jgi:CO/xanthine dehydrogenase Mo-binding subunit
LALVVIDRETGQVSVERFVVVYDVGRAVNPSLVEGQLVGGVAQGVGGAILEEFRYDEQGQPLATSFVDYLIPTAAEMPRVETIILETAPSPLNPLGVKGAGEGGITAAGAAIAAAIDDALDRPGLVSRLPIDPEALCFALGAPRPNSPRPR